MDADSTPALLGFELEPANIGPEGGPVVNVFVLRLRTAPLKAALFGDQQPQSEIELVLIADTVEDIGTSFSRAAAQYRRSAEGG